ncbi:hypothetical protein NPA31_017890 [Aurantimonas sp. MSK8Z-1]|uniref:hypothetical protein n=1 Tax=Mangrovibrevibacter kandeliae TaxID=2968473 RepID=UPI002118A4BD|nr:hypothetical protein [Aurantimonas sp. MSK8Z-1]MCW4116834.1 hypothetical protein [Aurantimonas sp. MSK8Z-1]
MMRRTMTRLTTAMLLLMVGSAQLATDALAEGSPKPLSNNAPVIRPPAAAPADQPDDRRDSRDNRHGDRSSRHDDRDDRRDDRADRHDDRDDHRDERADRRDGGYGDRHDRRDDRWDRRYDRYLDRMSCSPREALRKADYMGMHRQRLVDQDRRSVTVGGVRRGRYAEIRFAQRGGCPVISVRERR